MRPYWQDDPGLFDLPYDPISVPVSFEQAAAIATEWGARLLPDGAAGTFESPLMRRMPANWSNMSRAEKRAWSIDYMPPMHAPEFDDVAEREVAPQRTRRLRWPLRRREPVAFPSLEPPAVEALHPIVDITARADEPPAREAAPVVYLDEQPAAVTRSFYRRGRFDTVRPAFDADVIDLTAEDVSSAVEER